MVNYHLGGRDHAPFTGRFSFDEAALAASVKRINPMYDKLKPETWPLITLSKVDAHCQRLGQARYHGETHLPAGFAYDRAVLSTYEVSQSARERNRSSALHGSFFDRYPYNYDQANKLKRHVGMTESEYHAFVRNMGPCQKEDCAMVKRRYKIQGDELRETRFAGIKADQHFRERIVALTALFRKEQTRRGRPVDGSRALHMELDILYEEKSKDLRRIKDLKQKVSMVAVLEKTNHELMDENTNLRNELRKRKRTRSRQTGMDAQATPVEKLSKRVKLEDAD